MISFVLVCSSCGKKETGETIAKTILLENNKILLHLNTKEKSYIGTNHKQFFCVTRDGIKMYNFDGEELWSETFTFDNFIVMQRESYIAVGSKEGHNVQVFQEKGKCYEITSQDEIVYFSINESGGIVTIARDDSTYKITAYNETGKFLCRRTTYIKEDGYPLTAELSPNNKKLIMAYVAADEPQIVSRLYAMDVVETQSSEVKDNISYGREQTNNLVYEIEFISQNIWVAIGDKQMVWYDLEGEEKATVLHQSLVFVPYLYQLSEYGTGYLPVIVSEKPLQNIAHRKDQLIYFNDKGEETFSVAFNDGIESSYANHNGVIIQINNLFKGYDKLGNPSFEYYADTDVSKVFYIPSINRGLAVNKESVFLLLPKKGSRNG